jgi:predicted RNA binding protein YcfA (HicA-like mRNA interferase family)
MPIGTFTAVLHKESELYVAECPEVGTVSQGKTIDEALANLREATELYLEEFPSVEHGRPLVTVFEAALPRLPRVSGAQAIRALEKLGFAQVRQRGSHVILKRSDASGISGCVVPLHSELATARCAAF